MRSSLFFAAIFSTASCGEGAWLDVATVDGDDDGGRLEPGDAAAVSLEDDSGADGAVDAGADSDTDTDADSGSDSDSDSDADTNEGSDADADLDSDADSDVDSDTDTDADSDSDADSDDASDGDASDGGDDGTEDSDCFEDDVHRHQRGKGHCWGKGIGYHRLH